MESILDRLNNSYEYLRQKGLVHTQKEFAEAIGKREQHMSNAFKGSPSRLTIGLMKAIAAAFPDELNPDYLLNGVGDVGLREKGLIPHIPISASAGFLGGDSIGIGERDVRFNPPFFGFPDYDFTIEVKGDSMEPTYLDGDILACRKIREWNGIEPGRRYVIDSREGVVVKTVISSSRDSIRYKSDNPDFPQNVKVDGADIFGLARVVGFTRKQ